ncbi:Cytosolic non-specific dipeptidase [Toxocara canis]|uniref:Cytosolic non-specific dipeptidase n=1 Tax=Toxocara canis TaxID=6265 RepID=A0A0B2VMC7_TOXCA|nr:Cytosolic non-specific dipeptidase [Toxocara canis]
MSVDKHYDVISKYVDANKKQFIERLREAVAIPSVSGDPAHRKDVVKMIHWAKKKLESLGACGQLVPLGKEKLPDGSMIDLPPLLYGVLGNNPSKKTVLIYGHLDVQPASKDDGWNTEPFELSEKFCLEGMEESGSVGLEEALKANKELLSGVDFTCISDNYLALADGKLYGRGATDDKGPIVGWLNAIESFRASNIDIPVNIKFCLEGMEESGSVGLEEALKANKELLSGVDFTCISDNYWLGSKKPCITYGLR